MKLATTARDLVAALRAGAPLATNRRIPALSHALLSAESEGASLRFCDLDSELVLAVPAIVHDPGAMLVPVAPLARLLAAAPADSSLALSLDGGGLRIEAAFGRYLFPGMEAARAPEFRRVDGASFALRFDDEEAVRRALGVALRCISTNDRRWYLNGVSLDFSGEQPLAVATDGHTLAAAPLPVTVEGQARNVTVPTAAVRMLGRLRLDHAPIQIFGQHAVMEARLAGGVFRTKLVDGAFPEWRRVMPADVPRAVVRFRADEVLPILVRLGAISHATSSAVLAVSPDGCAALHRVTDDSGSGIERFRVDVIQHLGAPVAETFNLYLFRRLLAGVDPDVTLSLYDSGTPMRIDAGSVQQLLMPMRGHKTDEALAAVSDSAAAKAA